LNSPSRGTN